MKKKTTLFFTLMLGIFFMYTGAFAQNILYVGHEPADQLADAPGDQATVQFLIDHGFAVNYLTKYNGDSAARLAALDTIDLILTSSVGGSGDLNAAMEWDTIDIPLVSWEGWAYGQDNFNMAAGGGNADSVTHFYIQNYTPLSGRAHQEVQVLEGFAELGEGNMTYADLGYGNQVIRGTYGISDEGMDGLEPMFAFMPGDIMIVDTTGGINDTLRAVNRRVGTFAQDEGVTAMTDIGKHIFLANIYWALGMEMPAPEPVVAGNAVINSDFDEGKLDYGMWASVDANFLIDEGSELAGTNAALIEINEDADAYWNVQFKAYPEIDPEVPVYELTFMAKTAEPDTTKPLTLDFFGRKGGKTDLWTNGDGTAPGSTLITIDDTMRTYGPYYIYGKDAALNSTDFDIYELSFNGGINGVDFYLDSVVMVPFTDTEQPVIGDLISYKKLPGGNMALNFKVYDNVGYTTTYIYKDGEVVDTAGNAGGFVLSGLTEDEEYFYEIQVVDPAGNMSPKQNAYFIYNDNRVINPQMNAGAVSDSNDMEYGYNKGWFADGAGTWYTDETGVLSGENSMFIDIEDAQDTYWRAQFKAIASNMQEGEVYALSFMAKAPDDTSKVISAELFGRGPDGKENIWVGPEQNQLVVDDEQLHYGPMYIYERDGSFSTEFTRLELSINAGHDNVDMWIDSIVIVPFEDTEAPSFGLVHLAQNPVGVLVEWDMYENVGITNYYISVNGTPYDTIGGSVNATLFTDLDDTQESVITIVAEDVAGLTTETSTSYVPGNLVPNPHFNAGAGSYTSYIRDGAGSWGIVAEGIDGPSAQVVVEGEEPAYWHSQFKALPFGFEVGKVYEFYVDAKALDAGETKLVSVELFGRGEEGKQTVFASNDAEANLLNIDDQVSTYGPVIIWERDGSFSDDYFYYELSLNNGNDVIDIMYDNLKITEFTGTNEVPVINTVTKASVEVFTLEIDASDDLAIKEYVISKNGATYDTTKNVMWKDEVDPVDGDTYGVIAVDIMGEMSSEFTFEWGSVGVDFNTISSTSIYPNPASDEINVLNTAEFNTISILNEAGVMIYQAEVDGKNTIALPLENFSSGVYIVKLQGNTKIEIGKFIKQ